MPIMLGELITLLKYRPQDDEVEFAFPPTVIPTTLASYRGFYEQLALGWEKPKYEGDKTKKCLVAQLLLECQDALGKEFTGWKGGDYTMYERTPVWCANPGETGSIAIIGLYDCRYKTVLKTDFEDC